MREKKSPCEWSPYSEYSYFSYRDSMEWRSFSFVFVLDKTLWKVFRTSSDIFVYYWTSMKNTGTVTFINWKMLAGILLNSAFLWSGEYLLWRSKRLLFASKICKILQIMQKPNTVMIYYSFKMFHSLITYSLMTHTNPSKFDSVQNSRNQVKF